MTPPAAYYASEIDARSGNYLAEPQAMDQSERRPVGLEIGGFDYVMTGVQRNA
jgi:hypothetical protein